MSTLQALQQTPYNAFISFEFPLYIFLILLAILLFAGAKAAGRKEWLNDPFSLQTSKAVQGFAAIAIIIHHLSQELEDMAGPLAFFRDLGVIFVGIFFFFSGFGLYTSLKTKENYLKGFLKKRLPAVLIPFYSCNLLYVISACITGARFKGSEIWAVLSGWTLLNSHMWYIVEIVILYLAFFAIYRLIRNRTAATVVMGVFVAAMMAGSLMLCHGEDYSCRYWFMGEWWYNASFLFVIGIIFSKHSEGLRKIARKAYGFLLVLFGVLTVVFGLLTKHALETWSYWSEIPGDDPAYLDKLRCLSVQLPWIIAFVCFFLLVMMKVRFGNAILSFLGSISLELYLIHNLFLTGFYGDIARISSASMYIALTVLCSVGLAFCINGFDRYLISLISGRVHVSDMDGVAPNKIHSIDVMRIVMAFLVVAIHIPFPGKAGEVFITYGKTAVPFFFVACGYFLYRDDSREMMTRLLKQVKRIFLLYIGANVFYAVFFAIYEHISSGNLVAFKSVLTVKALTDFLLYNLSPFTEHLWFLGSLLYALSIMLLLNKLKVLKHAMFVSPALIAAYVILSHLGIGEAYQLRNAILVGLGYTMSGMLIRRFEKQILNFKHLPWVLWVMFTACCTTAVIELNSYSQGIYVPFVSCEILTYVIVLLCLRYPGFGKDTLAEKLGRGYSLPVYLLHIAVLYFLLTVFPENAGLIANFGAVTTFIVTASSMLCIRAITRLLLQLAEVMHLNGQRENRTTDNPAA